MRFQTGFKKKKKKKMCANPDLYTTLQYSLDTATTRNAATQHDVASPMSDFAPFVGAFRGLGERLRGGSVEWEVRFGDPPGGYLHVSKPSWGDENMDGVHLEAYVRATNVVGKGEAVVALHCESGCPGGNREVLMTELAKRIEPVVDAWTETAGANGKAWTPVLPRGVKDCTVVESRFSFELPAMVPRVVGRIEDLLMLLRRDLAPHVDAAIETVVG